MLATVRNGRVAILQERCQREDRYHSAP
jgi:hypothetical protein